VEEAVDVVALLEEALQVEEALLVAEAVVEVLPAAAVVDVVLLVAVAGKFFICFVVFASLSCVPMQGLPCILVVSLPIFHGFYLYCSTNLLLVHPL
jgi:hypothetical protein